MQSLPLSTALVALVTLHATAVWAQRRPVEPPTGRAVVSAPPTSASSANVTVVALALPRAEVAQLEQRLAPTFPRPKNALDGARIATLYGNRPRNAAVDTILHHRAVALGTDGMTTVIVVIGGAEDRDVVTASLAHTSRKIVVAHVDGDLSDANYDNTIIASGIKPSALLKVTNMRIYLPQAGGAIRSRPDDLYPVSMASEKFWTTYFGAKGDGFTSKQLASLTARDSSAPAATAAASERAPVARTISPTRVSDAPAVGDVVVSKLTTLKLFATPGAQGNVVATASKSDELVVVALREGFLQVQGNMGTGWVSVTLVSRQQ